MLVNYVVLFKVHDIPDQILVILLQCHELCFNCRELPSPWGAIHGEPSLGNHPRGTILGEPS